MLPDFGAPHSWWERAANELRELIARDYQPGDPFLSERQLSVKLAYSRDVIRNALLTLRAEGVIVATRGGPHRVQPVVDTTQVTLAAGEWITCHIATPAEARTLRVERGSAVVQIHQSEAPLRAYPAFNLIVST